ncbi:MAG: trypsin-like peptidase domain-containing protein [Actinomycetota bacterium]
MSGRCGDRRARRRFVAGVLVAIVVLSGCGDDSEPAATVESPVDSDPVPADHGLAQEQLDAVIASTVGIDGVACGRLANGSGFALTDDLVVTNAHVIVGIEDIRVNTVDGRTLTGIPVSFDADADLAILEVQGAELTPLPLGEGSADSIGVLVGWETDTPDPTPYRIVRPVTVRIESVGSTQRIERRSWQLAAEIDLGDSGAAMVDDDGEVVGVAFATSTATDQVGYAVRASVLEDTVAKGMDPNLTIPDC